MADWRSAYIAQAKSDEEIRQLLNRSDVAYSHRLHYLQIVTEKVSKGLLIAPDDLSAPSTSHFAFLRLLRTLRGRSDFRRFLKINSQEFYRNYISSFFELAERIEKLAPSGGSLESPNPEYPWFTIDHSAVIVPAEYVFRDFNPTSGQMVKLEKLLSSLLNFAR